MGARTAAHACAFVSVLVGFTIMVILLATKDASQPPFRTLIRSDTDPLAIRLPI